MKWEYGLSAIREKLRLQQFESGQELLRACQQMIHHKWEEVDQPHKQNIWSRICHTLSLMREVGQLHRQESDLKTSSLMCEGHSFRKILNQVDGIKRAHRIYVLPSLLVDHVFVIGDLHSDPVSLEAALMASQFFNRLLKGEDVALVFLGDYVDRGKGHLEIIDWITTLKLLFPNHVFLLRGNHDGASLMPNGDVVTPYRIPKQDDPLAYFPMFIRSLERENPYVIEPILSEFVAFFDGLALMAVLKSGSLVYMLCHGGIARPQLEDDNWFAHLGAINHLTIDWVKDHMDRSLVQQLLWSDPTEDVTDMKWDTGRFKFSLEHFDAYRIHFDFDVLIRGHEAEVSGFKSFFNQTLVTIFSSGLVDADTQGHQHLTSFYEAVSPKILHISNGEMYLMDLYQQALDSPVH